MTDFALGISRTRRSLRPLARNDLPRRQVLTAMYIDTTGASANGGTSPAPVSALKPPITATAVTHVYARIALMRSSRFTRPCQSRRSERCSSVSDARCGGSRAISPGVRGVAGALDLSCAATDPRCGEAERASPRA